LKKVCSSWICEVEQFATESPQFISKGTEVNISEEDGAYEEETNGAQEEDRGELFGLSAYTKTGKVIKNNEVEYPIGSKRKKNQE